MRVQVAQLAQTLATADPDGCLGVGPNMHWCIMPEVSQEALGTQPHAGGAHYAVELSLSWTSRQTATVADPSAAMRSRMGPTPTSVDLGPLHMTHNYA